MMSRMKIEDNRCWPKAEFEEHLPHLTAQIADKTLQKLHEEGVFIFPDIRERKPEDLTDFHQMILRSQDGNYHTGNVMGFLGYTTPEGNTEHLTISSRFAQGEQDFFLQYLLSKVVGVPNVFKFETGGDPNKHILDLLAFLFPSYLKQATRKGLFKMYQQKRYNDSNLRGTLDVARHIKQNVPFVGKIAYNRREYTYDNYLMELIRHTIEYIRGKAYGKPVLELAKDEVKQVVEVTPQYQRYDRQRIVAENLRHTVRHAYYHEYRDLQKLCIMILQNQRLGFGTNQRVYGVLFDGSWLWEEYVNTLVKEQFHHPMNKAKQGKHHLFHNENSNQENGEIYPDFIGNADPRIMADAKYKPIQNIDRNDYFQMLAYMMRFDAKQGWFFYPKSEKDSTKSDTLHLLCGSTYEGGEQQRTDPIVVRKIGFSVPEEPEKYGDFCTKMKEAEGEFLKQTVLTKKTP